MTSEVIIDVQPKEISIALLEDKSLVEYQNEPREASFAVGNIYVGKVRKLMPGLNACFVDVGSEKDAFLHYLDLGLQFSSYEKYLKQVVSDRKKLYPIQKATSQPVLPKDGSIQNVLKVGQEIMVQVVKEPINTKGPRLTCELSFAGRFMVLIPFGEKVSVSSKIKRGEERSRLKQLVQSMKPKNFGVIVRTVAEGKKASVSIPEGISWIIAVRIGITVKKDLFPCLNHCLPKKQGSPPSLRKDGHIPVRLPS